MIESMTKEQEAQVEIYKDRFLKQGLNVERLDVEKAKEAILKLYKLADLELAKDYEVKVFESPEAMCKFAAENTGLPAVSFISKICLGNVANYWVSFYSFINNVLGVTKEEEKVRVAEEVAKHCGPFLMFDNAILMSQRPTKIVLLEDNVTLHCDSGPAIDHSDGLSRVYSLNNIKVTEKIVMTKPEDFTKEDILNEKNADIRREIVRKIPTELLAKILQPKVIDEEFNYELLSIDLGDDRSRPFLKMFNPSNNTLHIEGVSPDCTTVKGAIMFRNSLESFSLPKTLDGKELFSQDVTGSYHQQGDCLAFPIVSLPKGAVLCNHMVVGEGLIRHYLENGKVYELDGVRYVEAGDNCKIVHPEDHETTRLESGFYKIVKVLEYDHWLEESREVID